MKISDSLNKILCNFVSDIMPTFRLSRANYGNETNICFLNSALQFLASIPVINEFFRKKTFNACDSRVYSLCSEISRLFGFAGSRQIQSAGALRTSIGSMSGLGRFKDGTQEDASDFLHMLLTRIEQEVGSPPSNSYLCSTTRLFQLFLDTGDRIFSRKLQFL